MPRDPWDRRPDEPSNAFDAFRLFLEMGKARTVVAVSQAIKRYVPKGSTREVAPRGVPKPKKLKASGQVNTWSKRFEWAARAEAFDRHEAEQRARLKDAQRAEDQDDWERRRQEHAKMAFGAGQRMFIKGMALANVACGPLVRDDQGEFHLKDPKGRIDKDGLQAAARIMRDAHFMILDAIYEVLPAIHDGRPPFDPKTASVAELRKRAGGGRGARRTRIEDD